MLKKIINVICHPLDYYRCYLSRIQVQTRILCTKIRLGKLKKCFAGVDISVFSPDCTGGVLTHTVGLQFKSPTVNLFFAGQEEYIQYLSHLREYSELPIEEEHTDVDYPCGVLNHPQYGKIHLHFKHYHSFEEAASKWYERTQRINYARKAALYIAKDSNSILLKKFSQLEDFRKIVITFPDTYEQINPLCEQLRLPLFTLSANFDRSKGEWLSPGKWTGKRPIEKLIIPFFSKVTEETSCSK